MEFILCIIERIKNVIRWLPIIWRDKDWDYMHLYIILHFKLKNMEEFFYSGDTHATNSIKCAHQIKTARILADRLSQDEYLARAMIPFDRIYGADAEIMHTVLSQTHPGLYDVVWTEDQQMLDAFSRAGRHSRYMKDQDKHYLFKHISKHIDRWWD